MSSGQVHLKSQMIRFVEAPDGQVVPDIAEKLPGRGVWVKADRSSLETAIKSGGFKRGFKANISVDDTLVDQTEQLLKRRVLSLMTMALKAGHIHMGFDQVKSASQAEPLAWRIEASNGAAGGRGKIRVLTKAVSRELGFKETPVLGCFTSAELGAALNREDIVHAAIKKGRMAKNFDQAIGRLAGFCALIPDSWEDKPHESGNNSLHQTGDKG